MTMTDPYSSTPDYTASSGVAYPAAPAQAAVQAAPVGIAAPPAPKTGGGAMLALGIVGICLGGLAVLLVTLVVVLNLGPVVFIVGGIMALVPLAIVILATLWIDRWEPEPRTALVFAFLWGAGVSVLTALIIGWEVQAVIAAMDNVDDGLADFLGAALQAPIVEESGKGFALLLIFWVARKHFDGPVDGIVYAAWVAAGFAFSENILYFGGQIIDSGSFLSPQVAMIFVVRGLMSPFAHVMFTACTGFVLGLAARRGVGPFAGILFWVLGLIPAIMLHAFWNGSLYFVSNFFVYFFLVQFPLFIGVVVIVVVLRRQEAKLTRDRLAEYAAAGWLHPSELDALATPAGRRHAKQWASSTGRGPLMKAYIRDATHLAFTRQRVITGRDRIGAQKDEAVLLQQIAATRAALGAPS